MQLLNDFLIIPVDECKQVPITFEKKKINFHFRFMFAANLINNLPKCQEISMKPLKPVVDLTLIIDGSRNEFENLQLISFLAESIDVSKHGSYFSVIHGTTGERMVNRTQSVAQAFQQLRHFSGRCKHFVKIILINYKYKINTLVY